MGDMRGDEMKLSSACQHKINHPLDNKKYPGGNTNTCREYLNVELNIIILQSVSEGAQQMLN